MMPLGQIGLEGPLAVVNHVLAFPECGRANGRRRAVAVHPGAGTANAGGGGAGAVWSAFCDAMQRLAGGYRNATASITACKSVKVFCRAARLQSARLLW
jgi:hypothetical protein